MEAEIDKLSLEELKAIALRAKINALKNKPAIDKWHENHPDKRKEYDKKYRQNQKLKKLQEAEKAKKPESPEA